jgi:hypothetical protein
LLPGLGQLVTVVISGEALWIDEVTTFIGSVGFAKNENDKSTSEDVN